MQWSLPMNAHHPDNAKIPHDETDGHVVHGDVVSVENLSAKNDQRCENRLRCRSSTDASADKVTNWLQLVTFPGYVGPLNTDLTSFGTGDYGYLQ